MSCPHMSTCSLFPMFSMRESLRVWQISYCQTGYEKCERYLRAEKGLQVAPNLLPNGTELPVRKAKAAHER